MREFEPIHSEVWRKLAEMEEALFQKDKIIHQLKRANSKQKNTIRRVVKERDALLEKNSVQKQHYRNGRKRGRTMNG